MASGYGGRFNNPWYGKYHRDEETIDDRQIQRNEDALRADIIIDDTGNKGSIRKTIVDYQGTDEDW